MPWREMGKWKYSSTFLGLGTRWRWVVSFTTLPLYPWGKSPQYPSDGRLGEPQSRSERCEEVKILHCRESNPGHPAHSLSLYRLSYPNSYNKTVCQGFIDFRKAYDSARREVLYNILIQFGVSMKLVRLIKMCLIETYIKPIHVNFHLTIFLSKMV
jgi:hypothetical protein